MIEVRRFNFQQRHKRNVFSKLPRWVLGPIQPLIQWDQGLIHKL